MQWGEVQGIGLGVIGTNQCNQGSPSRGLWSKPEIGEEVLTRWDLALGTDCDMGLLWDGWGIVGDVVVRLSITQFSFSFCFALPTTSGVPIVYCL